MAQWRHMLTCIWANIGSGNGLLPDGTKPLPEPRLTSFWRFYDIHPRAIPQWVPKLLFCMMNMKILHLKSSPISWYNTTLTISSPYGQPDHWIHVELFNRSCLSEIKPKSTKNEEFCKSSSSRSKKCCYPRVISCCSGQLTPQSC